MTKVCRTLVMVGCTPCIGSGFFAKRRARENGSLTDEIDMEFTVACVEHVDSILTHLCDEPFFR